MTTSTWRRQRLPIVALLILGLTITTGWTPAGAPALNDQRSGGFATEPANGIAMPHGGAADPAQLAVLAASRLDNLASHRASETSTALSARALYQARILAARAVAPAKAPIVKAKAPVTKAKAPVAKAKAPVAKAAAPTTYSGTNHFWFPVFGINRAVVLFPCSRQRAPDNYLYRWGCAGRNNVYLMGHASTVLRRLHDGYLAGRLHVGQLAMYADGNGRVRTYRVTTWRVVSPTNSAWAIAGQSVPSMTIQTCVGLKRLNVRLVAIN
jgi:hypothetical protein